MIEDPGPCSDSKCACSASAIDLVPVQGDRVQGYNWPAGTVAWKEHVQAWTEYKKRYGSDQDAARVAERGGFSYFELIMFLGRIPMTWRPRVPARTR